MPRMLCYMPRDIFFVVFLLEGEKSDMKVLRNYLNTV